MLASRITKPTMKEPINNPYNEDRVISVPQSVKPDMVSSFKGIGFSLIRFALRSGPYIWEEMGRVFYILDNLMLLIVIDCCCSFVVVVVFSVVVV